MLTRLSLNTSYWSLSCPIVVEPTFLAMAARLHHLSCAVKGQVIFCITINKPENIKAERIKYHDINDINERRTVQTEKSIQKSVMPAFLSDLTFCCMLYIRDLCHVNHQS